MVTWTVLSEPPLPLLRTELIGVDGLAGVKLVVESYSYPNAARTNSSGCAVVAVVPDEAEVEAPVLPAVLSAGAELTKPETRIALAARASTDGWVIVMVPLERAVVTGAEKMSVLTPLRPDPLAMSVLRV